MNREYWLDGFNFFHHWESTRGLLRPDSGYDIVRAIERSIRILSRHIGTKGRYTVVYLDGGLSRHEGRIAELRVRYCGPGRKADDRLADDLYDLGDQAKFITAVSNDRELKGRMRSLGAACLGVSEYLSLLQGKTASARGNQNKSGKKQPRTDSADILHQKTRTLSDAEVKAWLEFFGGEMEV